MQEQVKILFRRLMASLLEVPDAVELVLSREDYLQYQHLYCRGALDGFHQVDDEGTLYFRGAALVVDSTQKYTLALGPSSSLDNLHTVVKKAILDRRAGMREG